MGNRARRQLRPARMRSRRGRCCRPSFGKLLDGVIGCAIGRGAAGGVLAGCPGAPRWLPDPAGGRLLAGLAEATIGWLNAPGGTGTAACCTGWALAKACCETTVTLC